jgi:hypothetical protein
MIYIHHMYVCMYVYILYIYNICIEKLGAHEFKEVPHSYIYIYRERERERERERDGCVCVCVCVCACV